KDWMLQSKLPIRRFFNTSGMKYKELHLKDKIDALSMEEACALLATDGMLIKRPILLKDNQFVTIGYKEDTYERLDV
ncbi:arsenate reductase family protein, partial [Shigella sonnei]|nr:arsenate reductase family protein [Shigella sonnei]